MILFKRPAFFRDLERYSSWIAVDNPEAARRLIDATEKACSLIQKHPEMGSQEKFRKQHGIRSWRLEGFENYLIFYRSNVETVEVLRLLHGALNLPGNFDVRIKYSGFSVGIPAYPES